MEPWQYLPPALREAVTGLPAAVVEAIEEVRLRVGRPPVVYGAFGHRTLALPPMTAAELQALALGMAEHSWYAREDSLRQGFLTLPGGHRVGIAATAVVEAGRVVTVRDISGLNLRRSRALRGTAEPLVARWGLHVPCSVLVAAPPRGGKTTLIRDLARIWSDGGAVTVVVDERGELAGTVDGCPQFDLGAHTDVLDGWPKAEGILAAIRALGPEVVVVDELGEEQEARAVALAKRAGVAVVASLHLGHPQELEWSPGLARLWRRGLFDVLVRLDPTRGPDRIASVERFRRPGGAP
ncbi:MAG: stage III sporulation protein AA [Firmicutes bacterium]|nr:stage III sporulation protein AA [Alicyclobacillaceae bacterium]MCL6496665.1 stage III sporulation protein AA [Bacillota bacterium]